MNHRKRTLVLLLFFILYSGFASADYGRILFVQENPFYKVDKKDLKKVEEHIGLAEAYGRLIV